MSKSHPKTLLMPTIFLWLTASAVLVWPMSPVSSSKSLTLMTRLKLNKPSSGSPNCWDSLIQLQSCTGEVVLFFMNGETYLGQGCCSAIRVIQKHCWPSMLGSLGFTAEEGDVLQGYCDAATTTVDAPPQAPTAKA